VFAVEPPPADHPLVGRPDVVCTPHLGASTTEAQEDVSVEVAEVVVSALKVRNRLLFSAKPGLQPDWDRPCLRLDSLRNPACCMAASPTGGDVPCHRMKGQRSLPQSVCAVAAVARLISAAERLHTVVLPC